ncbi:MAG TPA: hypothetical protein VN025_15035 [Candidatus Dormibacteraeota bacterium]|jgi:hypothetical protein|nr:hypothetical protein [Candidatus Dormibacteraeota bacterium]
MVYATRILVLFFLVVVGAEAQSQPTRNGEASRDAQAIAILAKCIRATGGESAVKKVKNFNATGTIIHYWGGKEVKGSTTMQARGSDEFRMDSNVTQGTRSIVIGRGKSTINDPNGKSREVPFHNSMNMGALTLPFLPLLEAQEEATTSVLFMGQVSVDGHQAYQIRIIRSFAAQGDNEGILSRLSTKDFFIDSISFLPISARWMTHPFDDYLQDIPQQMLFSDFRAVEGVLVPFAVTETIHGQKTWAFQAETVKLNSELSQSVFEH